MFIYLFIYLFIIQKAPGTKCQKLKKHIICGNFCGNNSCFFFSVTI